MTLNWKSIFLEEYGVRAVWRILLFFILLSIIYIPLLLFFRFLIQKEFIPNIFISQIFLSYFSFLLVIIFVAFILFRLIDKRQLSSMGLTFHSRWTKEIGQGLLLGFILTTFIFVVQYTFGCLSSEPNWIQFITALKYLGLYIVAFFIQGTAEETAFRGYPFQAMIEGAGVILAVLLFSVIFGVAHLMNPNSDILSTINIILAGILLSTAYIKTRSLWFPSALHFAWNFSIGFIYSLPVSGSKFSEHFLIVHVSGPDWFTGGNFGPEGGLIGTLVILGGIAYIILSSKIKPAPDMVALLPDFIQVKLNSKYNVTNNSDSINTEWTF